MENFQTVYYKNIPRVFRFPNQINEYVKLKNQMYYEEIIENKFEIKPGRKLELITAYKNKSLMYQDVPLYIKERYELPKRDEGIDVIKINSDSKILKCYQCKDYNGLADDHSLGTFWKTMIDNYNLKNVEFAVVGSLTTRFSKSHKHIEHIYYDKTEFDEDPKDDTKDDPNENSNDNSNDNSNENPKDAPMDDLKDNPKSDPNDNLNDNQKDDLKDAPKIELRYYQKEAIEHINTAISNNYPDIRIKLPCGCGKTQLIYHYCKQTDKKILILVPKINIAEQIEKYFENILKINIEKYWTGTTNNKDSNIVLSVYPSVDRIPKYDWDMIFIDEAHHIIGSSPDDNESYIDKIMLIKSKLKVYLSATIDLIYEHDYGYSLDKAIEENYLTSYDIIVEYIRNKNKNEDLLRIIQTNKEFQHIIVYCNQITTATKLNKFLVESGIKSDIITGKTSGKRREEILDSFKSGNLHVICSVNCLNEGTDLPIADTAIFYDNRHAEINIIQCIGRVLRLYERKNKAYIVLLDSNEKDGNSNISYYMRSLAKVDNFFRQKLDKIFSSYNYRDEATSGILIKNKNDKYFNQIIKSRLTREEKLELCKRFNQKYERPPSQNEIFEDWNIGWYIKDLKYRNDDDEEKKMVENIFDTKFNVKYKLAPRLSLDERLDLCRRYYEKYRKVPNQDRVSPTFFEDRNLTNIINHIKYNTKNGEKETLAEIFESVCFHNWFVHKSIILNSVWYNYVGGKIIKGTSPYIQSILKHCVETNNQKIIDEFIDMHGGEITDYI